MSSSVLMFPKVLKDFQGKELAFHPKLRAFWFICMLGARTAHAPMNKGVIKKIEDASVIVSCFYPTCSLPRF